MLIIGSTETTAIIAVTIFKSMDMLRRHKEGLPNMTKIENNEQYEWAIARVEQLLPLVDETTPRTDPNSIELEPLPFCARLLGGTSLHRLTKSLAMHVAKQ